MRVCMLKPSVVTVYPLVQVAQTTWDRQSRKAHKSQHSILEPTKPTAADKISRRASQLDYSQILYRER